MFNTILIQGTVPDEIAADRKFETIFNKNVGDCHKNTIVLLSSQIK